LFDFETHSIVGPVSQAVLGIGVAAAGAPRSWEWPQGHCCVVRSRRAGDWFRDVVWLIFGVRWLPVAA
jgi:hypothetical protein